MSGPCEKETKVEFAGFGVLTFRNCGIIIIPQVSAGDLERSRATLTRGNISHPQQSVKGGDTTERIKTLRQARGIGPNEFARSIGVTTAAVLKMEKPGNYPSAEKLPRIAKVLKCKIEDLYGADTPPTKS